MILVDNTPVEVHDGILVKREDMSCPSPGPPFSKVRGLMRELERLKQDGFRVIGYTETSVSMAGWGVAWGCELLGLKAVIFDPIYKKTPRLLKYHRKQWKRFNATVVPIKAGMAKVNWYISKRTLAEEYGEEAALLPLGLPFDSSVVATYEEGELTRYDNKEVDSCKSVVVNVGSGTIAAGVLLAFRDKIVYGIMGRSGDVKAKARQISRKAGTPIGGLIGVDFQLVDPGWEYTEKSETSCPFPCHPYYDLKAWEWLKGNRDAVREPILFWNIGRIK